MALRQSIGRPGQGLPVAAEDLRSAQRETFRQSLQQARRSVADKAQAGRDAREELARLLTQEPLNHTEIDTQLKKIRSADMAIRTGVEAAVIDFAATLNPSDRAKLVEGLESRGQMLRRSRNN